MSSRHRIQELMSPRERRIWGYPLWAVRMGAEISKDAASLRKVEWQQLEDLPPNQLAFNLTELCNANCTFCCYSVSKPRDTLTNELFSKAVSEYHDMGGRVVYLNALTGEPLLDPHFFQKTSLVQAAGRFDEVVLTTNGILFGRGDNIESLISSGITRIEVSTAGFDKSTYERHMGVRKYDEFLKGLCDLISRNQESGNPLTILIHIRGSIDKADTEDFASKVLPLIDAGGRVELDFWRLYNDCIGQVDKEGLPDGIGFMPRGRIRRRPCNLSFGLGLLANGDMRLCNCQFGPRGRVDDLTLGNIATETMSEVWYSPRTRAVRRSTFGSRPNEVCDRCLAYWPVGVE